MKHAGRDTLKTLGPMLRELRKHDLLVEKSSGSFYLGAKAFLHFHEDPAGIFADVKENLLTFKRYRVTKRHEQKKLLSRVKQCLKRLVVIAPKRAK